MKLQDFLKQFDGLDPDTEVCKWGHADSDYTVEVIIDDSIEIRYLENNDKIIHRYYDRIQRDIYTKKVIVIP